MTTKPSVLFICTQDTKDEEARFTRAVLEATWSTSIPASAAATAGQRSRPK